MKAHTTFFLIFFLSVIFATSRADEITDAVNKALDKADSLAKEMGEISPEIGTLIEKEAGRVSERFYSEEIQEGVRKYSEDIKAEFMSGSERKKVVPQPFDFNSERIYIFVSSSMPESLLRSLISDVSELENPGISFILRGMVGNDMKKTVGFVRKLFFADPECIPIEGKDNCKTYNVGFEINPPLFSEFGVSAVPCFVYEKSRSGGDGMQEVFSRYDNKCKGCSRGLSGPSDTYRVSGAADFGYILERLYKISESPPLLSLLNRLNGGFYQYQDN